MIKKLLILTAAVGISLAFFAAAPASAQYEPAVVFSAAISNTSVTPGETVTISGDCESADTGSVFISIDGDSIGSIDIEDDFTFSGPVTIPDLAPGDYTVTATCGGQVLGVEITVLGSGASNPGGTPTGGSMTAVGGSTGGSTTDGSTGASSGGSTGSTGSGALARTGGETDTLLKIGGGLLLAGAAATLLATKRRSATV